MKITIIIHLFPPKKPIGGTETATKYIAEHLAKRGHEVHIITSFNEGLAEENFETGFHIHRLPVIEIRFLGLLLFYTNIVKTIQKISPDIVHVQSLSIAIPALISKKMLKIPYVVWGQGSDIYLPDWFIRFTSKIVIKNAISVIAFSSDMKRVMQTIYNRDIAVIPNGVDIDEYFDGPLLQERKRFGEKILYVGRLHPVKGVKYLIMAMKKIHEKIPEARLILVGDGEEREMLEALSMQLGLKKYVQFVGRVPQVQPFMQQADVFVLPSLSEGLPNVILEAMACGLPIVATRVGGIPDVIKNGVHGYLVEAKRPDEIAEKILILLQNDQLRNEISRTNVAEVKAYAWENIIDQLEYVYKNKKKADYS